MAKIPNYSRRKNTRHPTWDHDSQSVSVSIQQSRLESVREAHPWLVRIVNTNSFKKESSTAKHERSLGKPVELIKELEADTKKEARQKAIRWMRNHPRPL